MSKAKNTKGSLKFQGMNVGEEKHAHAAYGFFVVLGLASVLLAILTFSGVFQKSGSIDITRNIQSQLINRTYRNVTFLGVADNKLTFQDSGKDLTFELAPRYHIFRTNKLPYREGRIEDINVGAKIDTTVSENKVNVIYYK